MKIKIEGVEVEATQELLEKVKAALAAPKQTAKEWLAEFVEKPFDKAIAKGGCITYYRNGQWIFQQDFENKYLWCYYFDSWQFLEQEFGMKPSAIRALHKEVVGEVLNCKEFTPKSLLCILVSWVGEVLNCKEFTPHPIHSPS